VAGRFRRRAPFRLAEQGRGGYLKSGGLDTCRAANSKHAGNIA
jgi:hypothetical protein